MGLPGEYQFTVDGETYTLPPVKDLKTGLIRRIRKMEPMDGLFEILETVCDQRTLDALDTLDLTEAGAILEAWQQAQGIKLGESLGSSS